MEWYEELWSNTWVQRLVVSALVILVAVVIWLIIRRAHRAYKKSKGNGMGSASSVASVVFDTIKVTVFLLVVLVILQINGVNVTSLVAGLGIAGGIIGLALQDFFKDIIMGIHVLMDDFFQIGDTVQINDDEGIVVSFNLRTTKIRSLADGDIITICNRNIDRITKSSTEIYVRIPLPYELPVGRSTEVMNRICERAVENEHIEECRYLGNTELDSSSVLQLIRADLDDVVNKLSARRYVLTAAREVLETEGISVPYEQLDVHMKEK
ncbi:MAG: mechanosensitive ion channel family protein [Eubacterium sp.]|nr:mechanosensitive ion channel family protein [Eubacterium sp.]